MVSILNRHHAPRTTHHAPCTTQIDTHKLATACFAVEGAEETRAHVAQGCQANRVGPEVHTSAREFPCRAWGQISTTQLATFSRCKLVLQTGVAPGDGGLHGPEGFGSGASDEKI